MDMPGKSIDPNHKGLQSLLRIVGPILVAVGLVFIVIGIASFFSVVGGFEPPKYFWCAFVGMPLLFAGSAMTMFGFMGRLARYQAEEIAPVANDTFNYVAAGTAEGVRTVAGAIGQGLREGGLGGEPRTMICCHKCNALVAADAKFCDQCGQAIGKTKPCPQCRELNDPDARFCDNCGHLYV
jgi:RNA polymerase subunit RPABC4/transcription elongation factor Spt4